LRYRLVSRCDLRHSAIESRHHDALLSAGIGALIVGGGA